MPNPFDQMPAAPQFSPNGILADNRLLPTPTELIAMLDRRVIGQTEAKRSLAVAAYNHFLFCAQAELVNWPVDASAVLLVGPTGCGKSHLLKMLRECLGVPFFYQSCTSLTQNGFKGTNLNEVLEHLESELLDDGRTQPAIIVWDEVDKIRDQPDHHPVSSRGVQEDLLTYLDGTYCGKTGKLNSSRFLNIACGAFVGLDKIRKRQDASTQIGFLATADSEFQMDDLTPLSSQHFIDYGLIPEFVGRFGTITELPPLDNGALRQILCNAEVGAMVQRKRLYELHGIQLEFTDGAVDEVARIAAELRTGARGLKRILEAALGGIDHRLSELAANGVASITVTAETVRGEMPAVENVSPESRPLTRLHALRERAGDYARWRKKSKDEQAIW